MRVFTVSLVAMLPACVGLLVPRSAGAVIVTEWTEISPTSALGMLGDVEIVGGVLAGAPFANIGSGFFSNPGDWNADYPLAPEANGVRLIPVSSGSRHTFTPSSPLMSFRLYVDDFDSASAATFTFSGATRVILLTATIDIELRQNAVDQVFVSTTNASSNGHSDFILEVTGSVTLADIHYSGGTGNNGVRYTFTSVPSPVSILPLLLAGGIFSSRRR